MKIQQLALLSLFCSALTFSSSAQQGPLADGTPEEKAQLATEKQKESLSLNEEQEQDMYEINLKYIQEMEVIMGGGRSMSTMRKLKDMSGRQDKEVKEVLTKDQYKTYVKNKEQRREEMRKRMRG